MQCSVIHSAIPLSTYENSSSHFWLQPLRVPRSSPGETCGVFGHFALWNNCRASEKGMAWERLYQVSGTGTALSKHQPHRDVPMYRSTTYVRSSMVMGAFSNDFPTATIILVDTMVGQLQLQGIRYVVCRCSSSPSRSVHCTVQAGKQAKGRGRSVTSRVALLRPDLLGT